MPWAQPRMQQTDQSGHHGAQDTVNVIDLLQIFLPYYLEAVCTDSDEYQVMREVLNWAICPTDES